MEICSRVEFPCFYLDYRNNMVVAVFVVVVVVTIVTVEEDQNLTIVNAGKADLWRAHPSLTVSAKMRTE